MEDNKNQINVNNPVITSALFSMLSDIHRDLSTLKDDITLIKQDIQELKKEQHNILHAFPNGTDVHRQQHKKRNFFGGLFK